MLDIDFAPGVFATIIVFVLILPALYGMIYVDANWKKNKESTTGDEDAFN